MSQPCLECGACCAAFRVSFYWAETDAHPEGCVPQQMTTAVTPFLAAMRSSAGELPRCTALEGNIGARVRCTIYEQRSSTCRDFTAFSPECRHARHKHKLPPLDNAANSYAVQTYTKQLTTAFTESTA